MKSPRSLYINLFAWGLSLVVCVLAVLAWGQNYRWTIISSYQWFPLLGLLAFSLMWTHYIASVARQLLKLERSVLGNYFEATSLAVLVLICAHPGVLIWQRWRDGFKFPPGSYESYVRPGLGWVTLLGTTCLLIFLAYEFRRRYANRHWWKYVQMLTDAAMLGIFYHGLRLGSTLQTGWFHIVWWIYGISLIICLVYIYSKKYGTPSRDASKEQ